MKYITNLNQRLLTGIVLIFVAGCAPVAPWGSLAELPHDVREAYNRGMTLGAAGRHEEALGAFREVVRLKPDFAGGHQNLGVGLASLGRWEEALQAYQAALRLAPDFAETYINMAAALGNLGRYEEGLRAYYRAVRLNPALEKYGSLAVRFRTALSQAFMDPSTIHLRGLSLTPPGGEKWYLSKVSATAAQFEKITPKGPFHTVIAFAEVRRSGAPFKDVNALFRHVELTTQNEPDPRYKILERKVSLDNSLRIDCVRVDAVSEDHGVPFAPGSVFILKIREFYCLQPSSPRTFVALAYSQRFRKGEPLISLEAEVEPFLKSLALPPAFPPLE